MMHSDFSMDLLLDLPGAKFEAAVVPYSTYMARYVDRMQQALVSGSQLANMPVFRDYVTYCRWPIRQLEYSFAISNLPDDITGPALDVGSGVTPWPYLLAERGWPAISIDTEVEQVAMMKRHGQDTFGAVVDHRVADVRGFGCATGTFDLVTCVSVLEHLAHADVPLALAEIVRVCRPGGRIVLTTDIYAADDPNIPAGSGAFPTAMLDRVFGPLARACGAAEAFASLLGDLRTLSVHDLESFWSQHWKPGFWQERNRGYGAIGMAFDLPASAAECSVLCNELRQIALQMDYPPPGTPFRQAQAPDGTVLWLVGDDVMWQEITSGEFEADIRGFFEHYIQPGDIIFDVGANVGLYTQLFARLTGTNGQVHAFEPTAQVFSCLARNLLSSGAHVRLNRLGLSHESGPLTLFLANQGNACFNSFGEPIAAGASEQGQYETEVVWVSTLDAYKHDYQVGQIDLLKIDVEGWEERVLRGGLETLLSLSPILVLEFCSPAARNANSSCAAIAHLLETIGYHLFRYIPTSRTLDPVEVDRDAWEYANLIAIKHEALSRVRSRLTANSPVVQPTLQHMVASNGHDAHDLLLLLEENRALRQRLTAGILDREVTSLYQKLQISEADRAARLSVIERLQLQVKQLQEQLASSEADRAARLDVIRRQEAETQATIAQLRQQLAQLEHDRSAEREAAQRLQAELAILHNHPIIKLERKIKRSK